MLFWVVLGPAVRQVAIQDSPAGALLAKAQAQGGQLSEVDTIICKISWLKPTVKWGLHNAVK